MRAPVIPGDNVIVLARFTPDWRAGPDPYAFSWGDPRVYLGLLIVCGMYYGLWRWGKRLLRKLQREAAG